MGCDIHLQVEMKTKQGKWLLYNKPSVDRDYELFEKMAGVRGDVANAISPPKGLPDDLSESTALIYSHEQPDAHDESWLSLVEINQLEKWYRNEHSVKTFGWYDQFGFFFGNGFDDLAELRDPPPVIDIRFVFWFDN